MGRQISNMLHASVMFKAVISNLLANQQVGTGWCCIPDVECFCKQVVRNDLNECCLYIHTHTHLTNTPVYNVKVNPITSWSRLCKQSSLWAAQYLVANLNNVLHYIHNLKHLICSLIKWGLLILVSTICAVSSFTLPHREAFIRCYIYIYMH